MITVIKLKFCRICLFRIRKLNLMKNLFQKQFIPGDYIKEIAKNIIKIIKI